MKAYFDFTEFTLIYIFLGYFDIFCYNSATVKKEMFFLKGATVYIIDTCSIPLAINKLGRFARNIYLPTVRTKIFSLENSII